MGRVTSRKHNFNFHPGEGGAPSFPPPFSSGKVFVTAIRTNSSRGERKGQKHLDKIFPPPREPARNAVHTVTVSKSSNRYILGSARSLGPPPRSLAPAGKSRKRGRGKRIGRSGGGSEEEAMIIETRCEKSGKKVGGVWAKEHRGFTVTEDN